MVNHYFPYSYYHLSRVYFWKSVRGYKEVQESQLLLLYLFIYTRVLQDEVPRSPSDVG